MLNLKWAWRFLSPQQVQSWDERYYKAITHTSSILKSNPAHVPNFDQNVDSAIICISSNFKKLWFFRISKPFWFFNSWRDRIVPFFVCDRRTKYQIIRVEGIGIPTTRGCCKVTLLTEVSKNCNKFLFECALCSAFSCCYLFRDLTSSPWSSYTEFVVYGVINKRRFETICGLKQWIICSNTKRVRVGIKASLIFNECSFLHHW